MLVNRKTDYAIRCVLYLAQNDSHVSNANEISRAMNIPKTFLSKILQSLVRAGIAESCRGIHGGFSLLQHPDNISLFTIMNAIEGQASINVCVVQGKDCEMSSTCSVHPVWVEIRKEVENRLKSETIGKLITR